MSEEPDYSQWGNDDPTPDPSVPEVPVKPVLTDEQKKQNEAGEYMKNLITESVMGKKDTPEVIVPVKHVQEEEPEEAATVYNFQDPMATLGLREDDGLTATREPAPVKDQSWKISDWDPNNPKAQGEAARKRLYDAGYKDVNEAYQRGAKPIEGVSRLSQAEAGARQPEGQTPLELMQKQNELLIEQNRQLQERLVRIEEALLKMANPATATENPPVPPVTPPIPKAEEVDISEPEPAEEPFVKEEEPLSDWETLNKEPGVGHDAALAATEAFSDEAQNPEKKSAWDKAKEKGARVGSWLLERAKGLMTFGWWEVHQAEKVRSASKQVSEDVKRDSQLIKQESGRLSHEDAEEEADRMRLMMEAAGKKPSELKKEEVKELYDHMSESISGEKKRNNEKYEDQIVEEAMSTIRDKVAGYKTFGGEKVDVSTEDSEKMKKIEDQLRKAIGALRTSQIDRDIIRYDQIVKKGIDPDWYKRYVAGGVEAALGFAGVHWLTMPAGGIDKLYAWWAGKGVVAKGVKDVVKQVVGTQGGVENDIPSVLPAEAKDLIPSDTSPDRPLTSNLWNMAKKLLQEKGIENPDNTKIMEVTKELVKSNDVDVEKWGMSGSIPDTGMPAGMLIKVGKAALLAAKLANSLR